MLVTRQLTVAIDFHSISSHILQVSGYQQLSGYQHSSNIFLCSIREIHTGLEQHEGWTNGWTEFLVELHV